MKTIDEQQRENFKQLLKGGKEKVWDYIEYTESLMNKIDKPDVFDRGIAELLKEIRKERIFTYNQYKEVDRFITQWEKILEVKPKENDDYIIL